MAFGRIPGSNASPGINAAQAEATQGINAQPNATDQGPTAEPAPLPEQELKEIAEEIIQTLHRGTVRMTVTWRLGKTRRLPASAIETWPTSEIRIDGSRLLVKYQGQDGELPFPPEDERTQIFRVEIDIKAGLPKPERKSSALRTFEENRDTLAGHVAGSPSGIGGAGRRPDTPRGLSWAEGLGEPTQTPPSETRNRIRARAADEQDSDESEDNLTTNLMSNPHDLRADQDAVFMDPGKWNLLRTANDVRTAIHSLEQYINGTSNALSGNDKWLASDLIRVVGRQMFIAHQLPEIVQSVDFRLSNRTVLKRLEMIRRLRSGETPGTVYAWAAEVENLRKPDWILRAQARSNRISKITGAESRGAYRTNRRRPGGIRRKGGYSTEGSQSDF